jgi:hypothetical protein
LSKKRYIPTAIIEFIRVEYTILVARDVLDEPKRERASEFVVSHFTEFQETNKGVSQILDVQKKMINK